LEKIVLSESGDSKQGKDPKGELASQIRTGIQASLDRAEKAQNIDQFKKRLNVAKLGMLYAKAGKTQSAVQSFELYFDYLERWKKIEPGRLNPSCFNLKEDVSELLLINGVLWDLVKIYDQKIDNDANFNKYLKRYIAFSKGMSFEVVSAETLRKYLKASKPKHLKELKEAYALISSSKCFIATSLLDLTEEETIIRLRKFRDSKLVHHKMGQKFIKMYEFISPKVVVILNRSPNQIRTTFAKTLDFVSKKLV